MASWVKKQVGQKVVTFQQTFLISDINWTEFRETAANFQQRCSVSILLLNFPKMVFSAQNFALLDENFPTSLKLTYSDNFLTAQNLRRAIAPLSPCPINRWGCVSSKFQFPPPLKFSKVELLCHKFSIFWKSIFRQDSGIGDTGKAQTHRQLQSWHQLSWLASAKTANNNWAQQHQVHIWNSTK